MAFPLLAGAALGLSVAVPFGPISLICVQQSLNRSCRYGVVVGFGAATAQGIFATVAIAGADAASAFLTPWAGAIRLLSALTLVGLGIRTLVRARCVAEPSPHISLPSIYASSLMLSLSNPMTIIPYLALATVVAGNSAGVVVLSLWSIPGVMLAAATWYAGLSFAASVLRRGIAEEMARFFNLIAGGSLIGFGVIVVRDLLTVFTAGSP